MNTQLIHGDCLEYIKSLPDNSVDILFTDPPYALGSEIVIKENGKPDYKKAVDFMNKWDMPTGTFWEEWFKEAKRVLKHGGHCLMFGMDRQNFMFKYYGHLAGFQGKQSLYWYFISNFPKASDLSKMIDKNAGAEREKVKASGGLHKHKNMNDDGWSKIGDENATMDSNIPSTPLAKKYSGYKYSVAPLKQVVEEIMVFQKPMKTKSVLHDTLAMEAGDESITCGALDIDGNRVGTETMKFQKATSLGNERTMDGGKANPDYDKENTSGRYPAQAFLTGTEEVLDKQSGVKKGQVQRFTVKGRSGGIMGKEGGDRDYIGGYSDTGGCSKILHKCDFEKGEHDLYFYCPKVSKRERNMGCEEMEEKFRAGLAGENIEGEEPLDDVSERFRTQPQKNNHPTLKPIKLIHQIMKLFKTPNKQVVLDPFMGSGTTGIVCQMLDMDFIGVELSEEYHKIAEARIKVDKEVWEKMIKVDK